MVKPISSVKSTTSLATNATDVEAASMPSKVAMVDDLAKR
jgi:hypothetical protein